MFLPVEFDNCVGNEDVTFEVSDPSFEVDGDQNLVPLKDGMYSGPVLSIHGVSALTDDLAQVEITGLPVQSPHTVRVSRNSCICLFVTLILILVIMDYLWHKLLLTSSTVNLTLMEELLFVSFQCYCQSLSG